MNRSRNIAVIAGAGALAAACSLNPFGEDPTFEEERSSGGDLGDPTAMEPGPFFPQPSATTPLDPEAPIFAPGATAAPAAPVAPMDPSEDDPNAPGPFGPTGAAMPTPAPADGPDFGGVDDDGLHEEPGSADAGVAAPDYGDAGLSAGPVGDAGSPSDGGASD